MPPEEHARGRGRATEHEEHDARRPRPALLARPEPDAVGRRTDVADTLTEIDPDGAETFAANAAALTQRFEDLDAAYAAGLATVRLPDVRHHARGVRLPGRPLRPRAGRHLRRRPRGRAVPARLAAVEKIVRERTSRRSSSRRWSARRSPRPWPPTSASTPRCWTRSRDWPDPDGATTSRSPSANLDALRMALSCS